MHNLAELQRRSAQNTSALKKWLSVVAALAVGFSFFALWFWLLPGWLGFRVEAWRRRNGDGSAQFLPCWDSRSPCAAFGTSAGQDVVRRRTRLPPRYRWALLCSVVPIHRSLG